MIRDVKKRNKIIWFLYKILTAFASLHNLKNRAGEHYNECHAK